MMTRLLILLALHLRASFHRIVARLSLLVLQTAPPRQRT